MGQYELYNFLKKNKDKMFTVVQLAEEMGTQKSAVTRCVRQLAKHKQIKIKYDPVYNTRMCIGYKDNGN